MGHCERLANRNRHVFHHWSIVILQIGKARIDVPIKNVTFQQADHFRRCVYAKRFLQRGVKIVDEDRQTRDVVHVRMSDDNVFNFGALLVGEGNGDTAGINCHAVVD